MFFTSLSAIYLKMFSDKKVIVQTDTFPGYCWFAPSKLLNAFMWVYTRTIGLLILRIADKVLLLHEGLVRYAKEMGIKKYAVVHNGVDLEKIDKARPAKDIMQYKKKNILVTFVSRLDEIKGYRTVLAASRMIHEKHPDVRFLFVATDKYPEKRKMLQKEYPYINFVGFRKDIDSIWKATDINILASYSEGLPNTVMEAMAAGCTVIATPVGGVKSLIKDSETGLLFRPGDEKGLAKQLEKAIGNPGLRNRLGSNAKRHIEKNFNWKTIADKLREAING